MIPVNQPLLDGAEKRYLTECIETGWISSEGPFVERFEAGIAAYTGRRHGVAVSNGTAALEVAVKALGLGSGDEVIMPTFTIISCAAAVVRAGGVPVVVDADPHTWCMDVGRIEARITERTRAIMAVHIYGLSVDLAPLIALCSKHGLSLVEDAAEALGVRYDGHPCGGFGDVSTFSFYPNKHVTTGEGGMIVTDDDTLAERCRGLRNLCFEPAQRFVHQELGWNYRLSNLQAALGVAQLERLEPHLERKRQIGALYDAALRDLDTIERPLPSTVHTENLYWVYGIVLGDDVPFDARTAATRLREAGVGTRPFFWPMHEQPVLRRMGLFDDDRHPVAERLARRGLYLPSGLALTDRQIATAADALRGILP